MLKTLIVFSLKKLTEIGSHVVIVHQQNSTFINCIEAIKVTEIGSNMVLGHQLNSKDFNCIQAVKRTELGSHVVLVKPLKF